MSMAMINRKSHEISNSKSNLDWHMFDSYAWFGCVLMCTQLSAQWANDLIDLETEINRTTHHTHRIKCHSECTLKARGAYWHLSWHEPSRLIIVHINILIGYYQSRHRQRERDREIKRKSLIILWDLCFILWEIMVLGRNIYLFGL